MIDILLPTYNGAKYIAPLLDSIYLQTYNDFRIIVRDDGMSVDYRPRCPYCMYVDMMSKVCGAHASYGGSHTFTVCRNCGKQFEVILRREN